MRAKTAGKNWLKRGAAVAAIAMFSSAVPAYAQEQVFSFDIPSQDLGSALRAFARVSHQQVTFDTKSVKGRRSPTLKGVYSSQAAVDLLLVGSGLTASRGRSGVYIVRPAITAVSQGTGETTSNAERNSEIVVTGTNIKGVADKFSPVTVYTREAMDIAGDATVADALRQLPQNFGGGVSRLATTAGSSSGAGSEGVNLRGLGNQATLILLNGHRTAPSGVAGQFVDISGIPTSAIDQVEVLTDGASAIYGSDAIAGVVNIILRKDFQGAESRALFSTTTTGGAGNIQLGETVGKSWKDGNIMLSYEHDSTSALHTLQRDWSAEAPQPYDLVPSTNRNSVFATSNYTPVPQLTLSAEGFFNERSSAGSYSILMPTYGRTSYQTPHVKQWGGTADANAMLGQGWTADVSGTGAVTQYHAETLQTGSPYLDKSRSQVISADGSIGGPLFKLPGGEARLALGGQGRWEEYRGATVSLPPPSIAYFAASNHRTVAAGYAEAYLPIIGPQNDIPGVYRLSVDVAGRHESYSDVGSSTNPKVSIAWQPTRDLTARGTYSTSFRAPALDQLVDSTSLTILTQFAESAATSPSAVALVVAGTNSNLKPERSAAWTGGLDYQPSGIPNLKLSATYFRIRYSGQVASPTYPHNGNDSTFYSGNAPIELNPSQALIERLIAESPSNYNFAPPGTTPAMVTILLDERPQNFSNALVDGIDFSIKYARTTAYGKFIGSVDGTYLMHEQIRFSPITAVDHQLNTFDSAGGHPVGIRLRGEVGWSKGAFSAFAYVNYTGRYTDIQSIGTENTKIPPYRTADLSLSYKIPDSARGVTSNMAIIFSVKNVFNAAPPILPSSVYGTGTTYLPVPYDPSNADPYGRVVSLQVTKRF